MLLQIDDMHKTFPAPDGAVNVLSGVSLSLARGETVALTGESGSGKSTLLTLAAGLDLPTGGQVSVAGADLAALGDAELAALRRDRIGLVFQQFNLIPSLDAGANLSFHARLAGRFDADWCDRVADRLGLDEALDRYPEQLSGGQQQRVAIGRTLAARPDLMLADEPTGNLDEAAGDRVLDMMLDLVAATGTALLLVTHSPRIAARLSRQLHLSRGRLA